MSEEQYRDLLLHFGATEKENKISATTMTIPQLEEAVEYMKSSGFKIKRTRSGGDFRKRQIHKIQELWTALHNAGVMRQPYTESSASKFAFRHTQVAKLEWATTTGLAKTIEALKSMAQRNRVSIAD